MELWHTIPGIRTLCPSSIKFLIKEHLLAFRRTYFYPLYSNDDTVIFELFFPLLRRK